MLCTKKVNSSRRIFTDCLLYVFLITCAIITLFPFYIVLLMAFKTQSETFASFYGLPAHLDFKNFVTAWKVTNYAASFTNSTVITVLSVAAIIVVTSLAGYSIARKGTRFYNFLYILFLSGLMVPFQVIMIPLYKLGKDFGMISSYPGIIFLYACFGIQSCVFLYTGFVKTIPREMEESAIMDGSSIPRAFISIIFPLLRPVTTTVIVINALYIWNDFLFPLLFIQKNSMRTIPLQQYYFYSQYNNKMNLAFASFVLAMIPIVIFYFLMQKNIVKGITAGAIKG